MKQFKLTPEQEKLKQEIEDQIDGLWQLLEAVLKEREKVEA